MKKALLLISAFLICLSVLAGCGIRKPTQGSSNAIGDEEQNNGFDPFAPAEGNEKDFEPVVVDLNKRKIKVAVELNITTWANAQEYGEERTNPLRYYSRMDTQKRYNCTFVYQALPYEQLYKSLENNHIAGIFEYDAYEFRGYDVMPRIIASGAALNISEYYPFANDPAWNIPEVKNLGWWYGQKYAMAQGPSLEGYCLWYNKSLLAKYNQQDPWKYVDTDTWNFETFRKVALACTKRISSNMADSNYGFACETPFSFMAVANGGTIVDVSNGAPKLVYDSNQCKEAYEFVINLITKDKVMPSTDELLSLGIPTGDANYPYYGMPTGKVAMFPYRPGYGAWLVDQGVSEVGWVYPPKGPSANKYYIQALTQPPMYVIPVEVDEKKGITAAVQDMIAHWSSQKTNPAPITQQYDIFTNDPNQLVVYGPKAKDKRPLELLYAQGNHLVFSMEHHFGIVGDVQNVFSNVMDGTVNLNTALSAQKDVIQDKIDKLVKGSN